MQIYCETSSQQRVNNIQNLPGVLGLMLRKTGYSLWPRANDDLCQKESCGETTTNAYDCPNELLKFSRKMVCFIKATFVFSSRCFCCCCSYCIGQHLFLKKNGKISVFFSKKRSPNQCKTDRSSEICTENRHEIGHFLPIVLQRNLPRKIPRYSREIGPLLTRI